MEVGVGSVDLANEFAADRGAPIDRLVVGDVTSIEGTGRTSGSASTDQRKHVVLTSWQEESNKVAFDKYLDHRGSADELGHVVHSPIPDLSDSSQTDHSLDCFSVGGVSVAVPTSWADDGFDSDAAGEELKQMMTADVNVEPKTQPKTKKTKVVETMRSTVKIACKVRTLAARRRSLLLRIEEMGGWRGEGCFVRH
jgi:hypothetical protein